MTDKKIMFLHIVIALVFAGGIILSSWLFGDSENTQIITAFIIAGWMVVSGLLNAKIIDKKK